MAFPPARLGLLALAATVLTLAVGAPDSAEARRPAPCANEAAQRLVGKPKPSDAQARRLTGAQIVRQIRPGQAVTFDYRPDRVTITTNPATGKVVGAHCG